MRLIRSGAGLFLIIFFSPLNDALAELAQKKYLHTNSLGVSKTIYELWVKPIYYDEYRQLYFFFDRGNAVSLRAVDLSLIRDEASLISFLKKYRRGALVPLFRKKLKTEWLKYVIYLSKIRERESWWFPTLSFQQRLYSDIQRAKDVDLNRKKLKDRLPSLWRYSNLYLLEDNQDAFYRYSDRLHPEKFNETLSLSHRLAYAKNLKEGIAYPFKDKRFNHHLLPGFLLNHRQKRLVQNFIPIPRFAVREQILHFKKDPYFFNDRRYRSFVLRSMLKPWEEVNFYFKVKYSKHAIAQLAQFPTSLYVSPKRAVGIKLSPFIGFEVRDGVLSLNHYDGRGGHGVTGIGFSVGGYLGPLIFLGSKVEHGLLFGTSKQMSYVKNVLEYSLQMQFFLMRNVSIGIMQTQAYTTHEGWEKINPALFLHISMLEIGWNMLNRSFLFRLNAKL